MKRTVSVVEVSVLVAIAVAPAVDVVQWHGVGVGAEHRGLVHIVPNRVHVVAALELVVREPA